MMSTRFRTFFASVVLLTAGVLSGCEAAQVPLGEADELEVDMRVTGHWVALTDDDDDDEARLDVWAFNDHEYYVEWQSEDDDGVARIRTFASDLDGSLFANVQCVNCSEDDRNEWYFYQFELVSENELVLRSIENEHYRDAMADMTRSRDVRQYVQQHMHDEGFFSEEVGRFVRANPSDEG